MAHTVIRPWSWKLAFAIFSAYSLLTNGSIADEEYHQVAVQQCATGTAVDSSGLSAAWSTFRGYALKKEYSTLAAMVRFPLLAAGVTDDEPIRKFSVGEFGKFISKFFARDSGQSFTGESLSNFIRSHQCIKDSVLNDGRDAAQIANMVFLKTNGVWRLTQVFSTSD